MERLPHLEHCACERITFTVGHDGFLFSHIREMQCRWGYSRNFHEVAGRFVLLQAPLYSWENRRLRLWPLAVVKVDRNSFLEIFVDLVLSIYAISCTKYIPKYTGLLFQLHTWKPCFWKLLYITEAAAASSPMCGFLSATAGGRRWIAMTHHGCKQGVKPAHFFSLIPVWFQLWLRLFRLRSTVC